MVADHGVQCRRDRAGLGAVRAAVRTALPPVGNAAVPICLDAAGTPAPRPCSHRIHVVLCCLRWCLGLADAVCCAEVGEVRSGVHVRALPLGFFTVLYVIVQKLLWASMATTMSFSVFLAAPFHPCPVGRSGVVPLGARAAVHLAGMRHRDAMRAGPMARALERSCTASSSTTWTAAPT